MIKHKQTMKEEMYQPLTMYVMCISSYPD